MAKYRDWEEAARKSKHRKAIHTTWIVHQGRRVEADLVKPLYGDGYWYYTDTALVIRKATTREVDSVTAWESF